MILITTLKASTTIFSYVLGLIILCQASFGASSVPTMSSIHSVKDLFGNVGKGPKDIDAEDSREEGTEIPVDENEKEESEEKDNKEDKEFGSPLGGFVPLFSALFSRETGYLEKTPFNFYLQVQVPPPDYLS